ncbi:MAG: right-handed parallel beta-helix repeat-containing protein [Planctomycetota bacterium]
MTRERSILSLALLLLARPAGADQAGRTHAESDLHARPAVRVTVGHRDADIVGTDHRALQAAVDYVGSLGGGEVEIGPGEYLMRDSLHLRSRVTVRGTGGTTVLKKAREHRSPLAADGDFGEAAITVRDPEGFAIGGGVYVASKTQRHFHGVCATILNANGTFFTLSRHLNADVLMADGGFAATIFPVVSGYEVEDARVEGLIVDGNRAENPTTVDGCRTAGIYLYRGDACVIRDCVVRDASGDGISFQQSNDVVVEGCVAERCAGFGLHPGSGSQRPTVRNCRAVANGEDGFFFCWRVRGGVAEGNRLEHNGGYGMSIGHKDSGNLVRGNTIVGNRRGGVYWRAETEPMAAHRITFEGNTVCDNEGVGLFVDGATNGTVIRDNVVEDTGSGRQATGIRIGKDAGDVILEGNTIKAASEVIDERPSRAGAPARSATAPAAGSSRLHRPSHADVPYGTVSQRQRLDLWQARSPEPTPLVLLIHGGGWRRGDKSDFGFEEIRPFLDAGISVATLNYRFIDQCMDQGVKPPVRGCLMDAARALQTLRARAAEWNIDPARIGASGESAGGCTSLWLALHDDLADPGSVDPMDRQSTRLACAAGKGAQTSLDPRELREWIPNAEYGGHAFGFTAPGRDRPGEFELLAANREHLLPLIREHSPIHHVSSDDPPVFLDYPKQNTSPVPGTPQTDPTHTAIYGLELADRLRGQGVEAVVTWPGHGDPAYASTTAFLIEKLAGQAPSQP